MILMIDNHDSFTYNVVEYLNMIVKDDEIHIIKTEKVSSALILQLRPKAIIISPGPGHPEDYPNLISCIQSVHSQIPILGICLGFQLIFSSFGGKVIKGDTPIHGHVFDIQNDEKGIFARLPKQFKVTRYHSLIADMNTMPPQLIITASTVDGVPMAFRHISLPIEAVQYHPEAILSEFGHEQLANFLKKVGVAIESTYSI